VRGKSERIERILFAESLGLSEQKFFRKKMFTKELNLSKEDPIIRILPG
jgi:hypothetical protein